MTTPSGESPNQPSSPDPFDEALGRIIKVIRTDLGLERGDLADRAGISYSYMAAIENGQRRPSSVVLRSIAEALGLRTHLLVESAEARAEQPAGQQSSWQNLAHAPQSPPQMQSAFPSGSAKPVGDKELMMLFSRLGPDERALVRELMERLAAGRDTGSERRAE